MGSDQKDGYFSYITNIIIAIHYNNHIDEYIIYTNGLIYEHLKNEGIPNLVKMGDNFNKSIVRFLWMQTLLPLILWKLNIQILLSPLNSAPYVLKFSRIKSYLVIHSNLPWLHQELLPYGKIKAILLKLFKNISLTCADYIITVSENAKKELIQHTGIISDKVRPILLGIDHNNFNKTLINKIEAPNYKYILYVANSALHHNHINLIRAYQLLKFTNIEYHKLLLIMSNVDKNNSNYIRNFISTNKLDESIDIIETVRQDKLKAYYQKSTVYVFPSLSETFGLTTIEAMACGVPVIVSDCSSMPEINGDAALYFDPNNPEDIAKKIKLLLQSQGERYKMIKNGFNRVKRYNWGNTAKKMIDLFNEN